VTTLILNRTLIPPALSPSGVVTIENMTGSLSLESDDDLRQYAAAFKFLQAAALGLRESRDMLISLASEI
jgi:hypothetical protein